MAAAIGVGGDGGVSVVLRERAEKGGRSTEGVRRARGCVASRMESRATRGRRQAGGGRGAWARASATRASSWQRRKTTGKEAVVGWAMLGQTRWASVSAG